MTNKGRLLIVDDELEILNLMTALLQEDGFTVLTAESGPKALKILSHTPIEVMITDIRMPGMDGIDLIVEALKIQANLQCIVATGHGDIETAIKAMKIGAINFFQKPINIDEVVIAVENGMDRIKLKQQIQEKSEQILTINSQLKEANETLEQRVKERTTALTKTNKELARLAMAIDNVADEVIITDPDGVIEYVNPAFEQITGYSSAEIIGKNSKLLQSGKYDQKFYKDLWNTITSGKTWRGLITNKKKDGTVIDEASTISPIMDSFNKIIGFVAVKRDISEQTRLEEKLRQAQKMEAIGTLAGGIAHDFNNILSVISGYTDLAKADLSDHKMLESDLDEITKATYRATSLVRQILTFSRKNEDEKHILQVYLIIKETLKMLRSSLPTTIDIKQNITSTACVLADPTQIQQIVMNLCTNAYHAMRKSGGILNVSLKETEMSEIEIIPERKLPAGRYIQLSVSDTGTGMDDETKKKIFDPYFTTKILGEGTGLGLATVHGIVETHGGCIDVYSELEKGSTFHIYLPINDWDNDELSFNTQEEPLIDGTETIMIVDDESANLKLLSKFFKKHGYEIYQFTNGVQAFEKFQQQPKKYDLVITDMTMPSLTGIQLSQRLLETRADIPIILCTGHSEQTNREQSLAIGIKEYLQKPLDLNSLLHTVRKVLDNAEEK